MDYKDTHDHPPSKEEMLRLFEDCNNPTSWAYDRQYSKPKINFYTILMNIIIPFGLIFATLYFRKEKYFLILTPVIFFYFLFKIQRIMILMVEIYQLFAPIYIRKNCRFEPSCSSYMIESLKKYGVVKGMYKGIARIKRCKVGNGGYDYP